MSELKRVKIEYDGGIAANAKVTDADTGEMIPGVYKVNFSLDAGEKGAPFVVLYTYLPIVNVTIDAEIRKTCPQCGQEVSDATN